MGRSDRARRVAQVTEVAQQAAGELGLNVEDVSVTPVGKRLLVRIYVDDDLADLPEADETSVVPPVGLDDLAEASRLIGTALEEAEVLGDGPYVLEVTSPGVDRPLTRVRHFRRNVGRLVSVQSEAEEVIGRLVRVAADQVVMRVTSGETRTVPLDRIDSAQVQVEFGRAVFEDDEET